MGLQEYSNMIIGREKEGEGLPKHARKRVTIANQLVVQPKVSDHVKWNPFKREIPHKLTLS